MTDYKPCGYCQHYSEYEDRSTGWVDCGCTAPEEFAICDVKPCPHFKPYLASEGLIEQIAEEKEEEFWKNLEKSYPEED